jgi:lipopolysaccharide/colanic/teichoic acid biosynthesis glycosyltransferase
VVKRLVDLVLAGMALVVAAPLLAFAAVGISLSSPGPVLYRAVRVGRGGRLFEMYKLRTMHVRPGDGAGSTITARHDPRVFPFGGWLRRTKIDELPQLVNVLRGEMSIIGPRPEDPQFVAAHYAPVHHETLDVRPGLASPGSLYSTTHGESRLRPEQAERDYVERLLPLKLALDVVYVRRASPLYDAALIVRTLGILAGRLAGRRTFPEPPEMAAARQLLEPRAPAALPAPSPAAREGPVLVL